MKKILQKICGLAVLLALAVGTAYGQGSTNASMSGVIEDKDGTNLPGATIVAIHEPTGSQYGNVSNSAGRFRIANMQVGGPYTIKVSFIGYQTQEVTGVRLTLGQTFNLDVVLEDETVQLNEVVVSSGKTVFDGNRTGSETNVSEERINTLPTVSRGLGDFARLNPQTSRSGGEGDVISIAGMNNRFNAIYIDGAVNNDVFGLAGSGTNGGQTGVSPISIDAIEQFQIAVAPYDVTKSGFAGGSINAVTRSGSNEFEGSAYYFFRNESLAGKTPTDDPDEERTKLNEFSAKTFGLRVGGPIIKDKLFFFVNTEFQRDQTPQPFTFENNYVGGSSLQDLNNLRQNLISDYGYDPGAFLNNTRELNSDKVIVKLDYNINQNHKLTLRHSYTYGESVGPSRSSNTNINYFNNGVFFPSTTNSSALELKSTIGSNMSNNLVIGYTNVFDDRNPIGDNFPRITIQDPNDADDTNGTIRLGSEEFSTGNQLQSNVFTITDNLELYKGNHTITFGTHNEFYKVYNLFIRQAFGSYNFNSLDDFYNGNVASYNLSYSLVDDLVGDGTAAAAEFNAMQLGFYVQDEYQVTNNFKLTGGLRLDIPIFNDNTFVNDQFNSSIPILEEAGYDLGGAQTGEFIGSQLMVSPRLGFNWDVKGDKTTQIRGGVGIFTSRVPLVWPGGAYNNTGVSVGGVGFNTGNLDPGQSIPFNPDWETQVQSLLDAGLTVPGKGGDSFSPGGQIDLFSSDFKLPQVLRTSLAVDQKLPFGLIGTAEVMFSKTLNNVLYENINLDPSSARQLTGTGDNRTVTEEFPRLVGNYTGIYLGSNTNEGYQYNLTAQIEKPFENGFAGTLAYNYNDAYSIFDGTSSQNSSQWNTLPNVNGRNSPELYRSNFSAGSRVLASVSYRKEYLGFAATQISLFYNGESGAPLTYLYRNEQGNVRFNPEASGAQSLMYVPENENDIVLVGDDPAGQWDALNAYIENDDYLSTRRGQYAERNASRLPFTSIFDLRILQDFYITTSNGKKNTLQLSFDLFNLGNFINKDWGRRYFLSNGESRLLSFQGFEEGAGGTTPTFIYNAPNGVEDNPWQISDAGLNSSRWQAQIGVRYIFGN